MISVQNPLLQLSGNKYIYTLIIALLFGSSAFSQTTVDQKGASFYVDTIEKGETLFSLYKKYDVKVDDIKSANQIEGNNLSLGDIILIPIQNDKGEALFLKTHEVQRKETLYGISKQYNTSVEDIHNFNPEVKENGLKKGQSIKIPTIASPDNNKLTNNKDTVVTDTSINIKPDRTEPDSSKTKDSPKEQLLITEDSLILHVVLPGETLYRISKRYMVSIDTIRKVNDLSQGFRSGDTIIVPKKVVYERPIQTDFPNFSSGYSDTAYFLPLKKERYNILILLPLNLSKNGAIYRGLINRETFVDNATYPGLDFFMGMQLAMDSLKKAGLTLDVTLVDTRSDTSVVLDALNKAKDKGVDLIFGPVSNTCVMTAGRFVKTNKIPLVLPVAAPNKVLVNNPYVIKAVSSKLNLLDALSNYIIQKYHTANIMLVNSSSSKDQFPYDRFVNNYNDSILNYPNAYNSQLKKISLGSSSGRDLIRIIKKDTVNVLVAPSVNLGFCTNLLTRMNKVKNSRNHKDTKILLFGLDDLKDFKTITTNYKNKSLLHFPLPYYVEPNDKHLESLTCSFRKKYKTDPGEMGVHGFDIGFYFLSGLLQKGTGFFLDPKSSIAVVQNHFDFERLKKGSGIENQGYYIVKHEDYELKKVYPPNEQK